MPSLTVNDINLYYETHGSGDPLVLISGLGYELWEWHRMVPGLAEHFEVITLDNRGTGQSDKPPGPYSAELLADDVAGLLTALDVDQAVVLGHSMGGFVAQALVLSRPDLVSKLILAATNFGGANHIPVTPEAMAILTDMESDPIDRLRRGFKVSCAPGFAEDNPELIETWVAHRVQNPLDLQGYQAQLAIGLSLMAPDAGFESQLKNVHAPTLILAAEHDKVVPPGNAELLACQIAGSQVKIVAGVGHLFPLEAPDLINQAIMEFAG